MRTKRDQEATEEWPESCPRCGNSGDNDRCGGFAWTYSAPMRRIVCKLCGWPVPKEVALGRILAAEGRLARIAQIIEAVDNRAMAADGPVTPTLQEMTQTEMSEIYALATGEQEVG